LYSLGDIRLDQGELNNAEESFQTGLNLANQIGDKSAIASGRLFLARLRLETGNAAKAEELARQAAAEFNAEGLKDLESSARNLLASALLELDRNEDAEKELAVMQKSSLRDPTLRLAAAITSARLQVRSGKLKEGIRELDSVAAQSKSLGIAGLQFEARLAQGETALFGGDKRAALSLLYALQKDAARKGFKQIEARAKVVSQQITVSGDKTG